MFLIIIHTSQEPAEECHMALLQYHQELCNNKLTQDKH